MTDEAKMATSEITAHLRHRSPAVTRAWISALPDAVKLNVDSRDKDTGEKLYLRSAVEAAIEATTQRGPYEKARPTEEPRDDHDRRIPPD